MAAVSRNRSDDVERGPQRPLDPDLLRLIEALAEADVERALAPPLSPLTG